MFIVSRPDEMKLCDISTWCIADALGWMKSNRLHLNSSKTEFVWCATTRRLHLNSLIQLGMDRVQPMSSVCNHRNLNGPSFHHAAWHRHHYPLMFQCIIKINSIHQSLTHYATKTHVCSLVLSWQPWVMSYAGYVSNNVSSTNSVWRCFAPKYIVNMCSPPLSAQTGRHLRSADNRQLHIPHTKTEFRKERLCFQDHQHPSGNCNSNQYSSRNCNKLNSLNRLWRPTFFKFVTVCHFKLLTFSFK